MSRPTKSELAALDISSIEDGVIPARCFACHSKQQVLVKVTYDSEGNPIKTKNRVGNCMNEKCFRHINLGVECRTWIPDYEFIPNLRPLGADRSSKLI